jgi:hypothetical protein
MPRLSALPRPENRLILAADTEVTICADVTSQTFCFVGYDPQTLRVRWVQRAPGCFRDPRGHHDHCGRDGLWRNQLDRDHRCLLDRFQPETLVHIETDDPGSDVATGAAAAAA